MPTCPHARTQLIAKDKDEEYLECLDCGAILERDEMPKAVAEKSSEEAEHPEGRASESLSDA